MKPTPLRYEYKYFVPMSKLDLLRDMINPFTKLDKYASSRPSKEYTVRSIYFDTPDFECYTTKIAGLKHRNKVRLRGYNEEDGSNIVFMEIKRKYEGPIMKNRAPIRFEDFKKLVRSEGQSVDDLVDNTKKFAEARDNARRFLYNIYARKMRPVVVVIYEREPFLSNYYDPENNLRITLDKNLRCCPYPAIGELFEEKRLQHALRGYFILEVKFNKYYPSWMKTIIGTLGLHRESASKYCISIDAHNSINVYGRYDTFTYGRMFRKDNKTG